MPVVMSHFPPPCLAVRGPGTATQSRNSSSHLALLQGQVGTLILSVRPELLNYPLTEDRGLSLWDFSCPTGVSGWFVMTV